MPDRRRITAKQMKRDQSSTREVREELSEEIRSGGIQARPRQPNRDRARGDRDRTGLRRDEGMSRADIDEKDDAER